MGTRTTVRNLCERVHHPYPPQKEPVTRFRGTPWAREGQALHGRTEQRHMMHRVADKRGGDSPEP